MSRMLLALDDGPGAEELLKSARTLARGKNAELWVVHVLPPSPLSDEEESAPHSRSLLEKLDRADRWLGGLLRGQPDSERPVVVVGDPPHEIIATAKMVGADALILGARPRSQPRAPESTRKRVVESALLPVLLLAVL
jgi:nucleotide-binding universal stress UspA family protein